MNDKKICFIICTNSPMYYEECVRYISRLIVPNGYAVELLQISEARSMTSGYNEGMQATDAKYKIYMHQDVFIFYPYFLQSVLDIFASDPSIGMIGMVGAEKLATDGVMWHVPEVGNLYGDHEDTEAADSPYDTYRYRRTDGLWDVTVIDGLMMITSVDMPWREDLFDGWDFYDVSQSLEMKRAGRKIVVPLQRYPWCFHDDGILNLRNYDKYRKICMKEYSEFFR